MTKPPYQTDDYGRAAYLALKNFPFLGVVGKKDVYKKLFIFEDSPEIRQESDNWEHNLTEEATNYKKYFIKISFIKKALREETLDV